MLIKRSQILIAIEPSYNYDIANQGNPNDKNEQTTEMK